MSDDSLLTIKSSQVRHPLVGNPPFGPVARTVLGLPILRGLCSEVEISACVPLVFGKVGNRV